MTPTKPTKPTAWREASHGPLEPLGDGLWHVEATLPSLPIGRRMTVIRLSDGSLAVHSAVCCDDATMAAIDALGAVRWIIVPSGFHRMDAPRFTTRYPDARVIAMPASHARVAQVVSVGGDHTSLSDPSLSYEPIDGITKEGVLVHRDAAGKVALVFNDTFMNLPDRLPGFRGFVVKALGSLGGPKVTRTARIALVKDRRALAAHLRRLADTPGLAAVVPGHGAVVRDDPGAALRRAADGL
jgi:hypothetical protein